MESLLLVSFPSFPLSLSLCYQSHLLSSFSASAMREKKRSKKMSNPDNNTPPVTRKSLQTSSWSGKRNQSDSSPSLDSLVCYHQPNLLSLFHWVIIMIVFLYHIPSLVPVMYRRLLGDSSHQLYSTALPMAFLPKGP